MATDSASGKLGNLGCRSGSSLVLLDDLGGNSVHIGDSLGGEALSHDDGSTILRLVAGGSDDLGSLELHKRVSDVLSGGKSVVLGLGASAGLGSVVLAEGVHTNLLLHVDLVGDGGSTGVKPVVIEGTKFLVVCGFNIAGPLLSIIKLDLGKQRKPRQKASDLKGDYLRQAS